VVISPRLLDKFELTMQELEVVQNPSTKICESPLQLKSNCGTLVIDDFGRQRMTTDLFPLGTGVAARIQDRTNPNTRLIPTTETGHESVANVYHEGGGSTTGEGPHQQVDTTMGLRAPTERGYSSVGAWANPLTHGTPT
jgi:hypothetical protein